jgi:hypothetical protein
MSPVNHGLEHEHCCVSCGLYFWDQYADSCPHCRTHSLYLVDNIAYLEDDIENEMADKAWSSYDYAPSEALHLYLTRGMRLNY